MAIAFSNDSILSTFSSGSDALMLKPYVLSQVKRTDELYGKPLNTRIKDHTVVNLPNLLTLTLGPTPWLVGGLMLLGLNLLLPNPTMVALGFAGIVTALVAITIQSLPSQLLIFGVLAAIFTRLIQRFLPQESEALEPARYARVHDPIPRGGVGRVQYEGTVWQARCQISDVAIAPPSLVSVVERQGNTLIVMPIPTTSSQ